MRWRSSPRLPYQVETKRGYECPDDHLNTLQEHLPKITKILVIGWRGTEQHFLTLLKELLSEDLPTCVVAGSKDGAEEVIARIASSGVHIAGTAAEGGFTDFIARREGEVFLRS
jgi:hypothetical protein